MQKITPFLWFDNNLEEAIQFYKSIFKDVKVSNEMRYTDAGPGPKGTIMGATFQLNGQQFMAMNGGPQFKFTPAISMYINCKTQEEVDELWEKLSEGGEKQRCGWLQDKFGLSWQVIPDTLSELLQSPEPGVAGRVMEAMMKMDKIDIAGLKQAAGK